MAEGEAISKKITETENLLKTLEDSKDDIQGRIHEANFQAGHVLSYFHQTGQGIPEVQVFETSPLLLDNDFDETPSAEPFANLPDSDQDSEPLSCSDVSEASKADLQFSVIFPLQLCSSNAVVVFTESFHSAP
ncbi:hypothetical protein HYPSUDRAFT_959199 [Hypholoma sublateritium FD-334 SS-4]|uniref:Uncharacterized protein n=1 Tax=Hypholoma sublateritium (strain FD-334 SS-4) TaxID=945553 RepID=A0A0D2KUR8_HYPSF|nr:hypothetical protein HYPSUDRAFT_959199 [Hypholoma sublateritium FD-334 SS-4]